MGKYMKKSKIAGDVAVMEVTQSTTLGVRTRAKTLALQRLHSSSPPAAPNPDASCYLQLRSRRLEKPPPPTPPTATVLHNETKKAAASKEVNPDRSLVSKGSLLAVKAILCDKERHGDGCFGEKEEMLGWECEAEASFGENCLDFEPRERSTRESTPCSLIGGSNGIRTPGSTTRRTGSTATNRRVSNNIQRNVPTTHEMDEFFAYAELQQQRLFIEKYNFDVANDVPLLGRYEWVPIIP